MVAVGDKGKLKVDAKQKVPGVQGIWKMIESYLHKPKAASVQKEMNTQISQIDDSSEGWHNHDHDERKGNLDHGSCQVGVVDTSDIQMDSDTSTLVGNQGSIWDVEDEIADWDIDLEQPVLQEGTSWADEAIVETESKTGIETGTEANANAYADKPTAAGAAVDATKNGQMKELWSTIVSKKEKQLVKARCPVVRDNLDNPVTSHTNSAQATLSGVPNRVGLLPVVALLWIKVMCFQHPDISRTLEARNYSINHWWNQFSWPTIEFLLVHKGSP